MDTRETPHGETVESVESVEGTGIALDTAVSWAAGPSCLGQVGLIDILLRSSQVLSSQVGKLTLTPSALSCALHSLLRVGSSFLLE